MGIRFKVIFLTGICEKCKRISKFGFVWPVNASSEVIDSDLFGCKFCGTPLKVKKDSVKPVYFRLYGKRVIYSTFEDRETLFLESRPGNLIIYPRALYDQGFRGYISLEEVSPRIFILVQETGLEIHIERRAPREQEG